MLTPAARAANIAIDTLNTQRAVRAQDELRRAWFGQLNELTATARALAVADDTYEFVERPNIPYVDAHYDPERLAGERIDTVLIINLHGRPLFWRRLNQGGNRGFPDARLFLAELPPLPAPGVAGVPGLAGAAALVHGPKLLVAMPIYASSGSGVARGWLIATRALDAHLWHRYEELAHVPVPLLDPPAPKSTTVVRQKAAAGSVTASFFSPSVPSLTLMLIITFVAVVATGIMRYQRRELVWLKAPQSGNLRHPGEAANSGSSDLAVAPISTRISALQTRDPLLARLAAGNAVFRYQPQIDLQTGRVAGVEALLCVPGLHEFRPAMELTAEIEAAGLGLALVEHRLHDACRQQRAWLRTIGHEFPIGVPVSQRTLINAAFLPLVQRILAENELAPSFLELQVEEAALGPSAAALRSVTNVHGTGISIAIDGFNAAHSSLRLLSILPISKLRVHPYLLLRIGDRPSEGLLFDGIIGAARGLGIVVCATGITTPELLSAVLRHGRPLAQGAALGRALAGDEFLALLRGGSVDTVILRPLDFGEAQSGTLG